MLCDLDFWCYSMNPGSWLLYHGQVSYIWSVSVHSVGTFLTEWWAGRCRTSQRLCLMDFSGQLTLTHRYGLVVESVSMATVVMKTDPAYWKYYIHMLYSHTHPPQHPPQHPLTHHTYRCTHTHTDTHTYTPTHPHPHPHAIDLGPLLQPVYGVPDSAMSAAWELFRLP